MKIIAIDYGEDSEDILMGHFTFKSVIKEIKFPLGVITYYDRNNV